MTITVGQTFTTQDMTLVAVLKLRGIECLEHQRAGNGCQWVFDKTQALEEIVDEYAAGEAYVEPVEFARKLGLVRTSMYQFLGHKPRRVRQ